MIQFVSYKKNRMYLSFTEVEFNIILTALKKQFLEDEITGRIDALAMAFNKERRGNWLEN